jgi:hypothetical protein
VQAVNPLGGAEGGCVWLVERDGVFLADSLALEFSFLSVEGLD